jgi:hypothetical protein
LAEVDKDAARRCVRRRRDILAVVFLASAAASLVTGHTILLDGGWTAQ